MCQKNTSYVVKIFRLAGIRNFCLRSSSMQADTEKLAFRAFAFTTAWPVACCSGNMTQWCCRYRYFERHYLLANRLCTHPRMRVMAQAEQHGRCYV